ncbi:MAG: hypothetical protein FJX74_04345 [Armatimonadetes bacterium]|nr:hypothetical protein [Armatimonadota bacterium]
MSNPLLLTELSELVADEALFPTVQAAVGYLHRGSPEEIEARRADLQDPERRTEAFEGFWNRFVEPDGVDSLNRGEPEAPGLTVHMAYQGVVADHIIRLFAEGGRWWQRAQQIVDAKVA